MPHENHFFPSFSSIIAAKLADCDYTQEYIAKRCNYGTHQMVSGFKTGKVKVPAKAIEPICKLLGLNVSDMTFRYLAEYESDLYKLVATA